MNINDISMIDPIIIIHILWLIILIGLDGHYPATSPTAHRQRLRMCISSTLPASTAIESMVSNDIIHCNDHQGWLIVLVHDSSKTIIGNMVNHPLTMTYQTISRMLLSFPALLSSNGASGIDQELRDDFGYK